MGKGLLSVRTLRIASCRFGLRWNRSHDNSRKNSTVLPPCQHDYSCSVSGQDDAQLSRSQRASTGYQGRINAFRCLNADADGSSTGHPSRGCGVVARQNSELDCVPQAVAEVKSEVDPQKHCADPAYSSINQLRERVLASHQANRKVSM